MLVLRSAADFLAGSCTQRKLEHLASRRLKITEMYVRSHLIHLALVGARFEDKCTRIVSHLISRAVSRTEVDLEAYHNYVQGNWECVANCMNLC